MSLEVLLDILVPGEVFVITSVVGVIKGVERPVLLSFDEVFPFIVKNKSLHGFSSILSLVELADVIPLRSI